ncbi:MAG: response regulator [Planctomycetota bacterium]
METRFGRGTWYGQDVIYGVARDIGERLAADAGKQDLEAQVRYAQKLESLGVLAGGIAHDFNNLLTGILGHADLALLDLPEDSPAHSSISQILVGARRAADLAKQMLAYSGKGRFVVEHVDLAEVVREMSGLLEISVSKKGTIRYRYDAFIPPIEADATQMRQVVMNLILNASEAIGNEGGNIDVRVGCCECTQEFLAASVVDDKLPAGRYVYLEVEDTGVGMSEETLARIFDPFFTTKFTGRGLGLAAVLGIVRGHKGSIQVSSVPGQGTTFRVLIPALASDPSSVDGVDEFAANRSQDWKGEGTILLVDDEADVRATAENMLRRLGFDVLTATNGAEAVQLFGEHQAEIRAVLLDLSMPEMDGEETYGAIRRLQPDVKVFLSSGFTRQEVNLRFRDNGLAGFVQKPYSLGELRKSMSSILPS